MRRHLAVGLLVVAATCVLTGQSEDTRTFVTEQVRKLYGADAPSQVVFVTVPSRPSGLAWGGVPKGDKAAAKGDDKPEPDRVSTAVAAIDDRPARNDPKAAALGDLAEGVIVAERGNELYLDTSPCEARIATFLQPFRKTEIGKVQCRGVTHTKYEVRQK